MLKASYIWFGAIFYAFFWCHANIDLIQEKGTYSVCWDKSVDATDCACEYAWNCVFDNFCEKCSETNIGK